VTAGSVPENEQGDGWVGWTTSDEAFSYQPALHFGAFGLFWGRGPEWGAPEGHVRISVLDHRDDAPSSPQGMEWICKWDRLEVIATCVLFAAKLEAPCLDWVRTSAERMWMGLVET